MIFALLYSMVFSVPMKKVFPCFSGLSDSRFVLLTSRKQPEREEQKHSLKWLRGDWEVKLAPMLRERSVQTHLSVSKTGSLEHLARENTDVN